MASASSARTRLKKLSKEIPDDKAIRELLHSLESEDSALADHAIALTAASVVEKALEVALLSRFVSLSGTERTQLFSYEKRGPLADLSARIKMAYALSIFGPRTRDDLNSVRDVRNAFAHSIQLITFNNPDVAHICESLHAPSTVTIAESGGIDRRTPRGQYIVTALSLARRFKTFLAKPEQNQLAALMRVYHLP